MIQLQRKKLQPEQNNNQHTILDENYSNLQNEIDKYNLKKINTGVDTVVNMNKYIYTISMIIFSVYLLSSAFFPESSFYGTIVNIFVISCIVTILLLSSKLHLSYGYGYKHKNSHKTKDKIYAEIKDKKSLITTPIPLLLKSNEEFNNDDNIPDGLIKALLLVANKKISNKIQKSIMKQTLNAEKVNEFLSSIERLQRFSNIENKTVKEELNG